MPNTFKRHDIYCDVLTILHTFLIF